MEIDNLLEYSDHKLLRQWLEENHSTMHHCWVATYRGKTPMPNALSYLLHILLKIFATIRIFYQWTCILHRISQLQPTTMASCALLIDYYQSKLS